MKRTIVFCVMVLGLVLLPLESKASNKHDRDRYEHKFDKKHQHRKLKKAKKHGKSNGVFYKLPSGLYKKVTYSHRTPAAKPKKYRKGDKLNKEMYRRGRVLKHDKRNGVVVLEIDRRIYHLMHDSRKILAIIMR
ncbi:MULTISPECIES: hypothetical protein [unclassified Pseudoalteromonas]|uniref:hypothetical protein n=1 Tax=unclassified Pseudoalteromonas TaxID=194690 RepID=UPI0025B45518|nr:MULTISPECIES: hypothetical protein [unclassified Pseudoalteromonas]MDN3379966.1 hypothetical protein [Pseudoalteromonas sp. APC 3893]MDN3388305.1 hypothetical protein [Pseudoalteromonas sp. APC 4017]